MARKELLSQLYIVAIDLPQVETLAFQYTPDKINYERTANVSNVAIVGRNNDLHHFVGGSTSLSFAMDFYSLESNRMDVKRKIKWLESMTYSERQRPPSRLKIVFGDLFKDEIWILTSVGVEYDVPDLSAGALPLYAIASLNFVRDTERDIYGDDIRNMNYGR